MPQALQVPTLIRRTYNYLRRRTQSRCNPNTFECSQSCVAGANSKHSNFNQFVVPCKRSCAAGASLTTQATRQQTQQGTFCMSSSSALPATSDIPTFETSPVVNPHAVPTIPLVVPRVFPASNYESESRFRDE